LAKKKGREKKNAIDRGFVRDKGKRNSIAVMDEK